MFAPTFALTPEPGHQVTPLFRSCRTRKSKLTTHVEAHRDRIEISVHECRSPAGHIMIGLAQHAADQPDATPETRALAQRLRARHAATSIGE